MTTITDLSDCVSLNALRKKGKIIELVDLGLPGNVKEWKRFLDIVDNGQQITDTHNVTPYMFIRWLCGLIEDSIEEAILNAYRQVKKINSQLTLKEIADCIDLDLYQFMFLYVFDRYRDSDFADWIKDVVTNHCTFRIIQNDCHTAFLYNILLESKTNSFFNCEEYERRDGTSVYKEFNVKGSFNELFVVKGSRTPGLRNHIVGFFHVTITKPLYYECLSCNEEMESIDRSRLVLSSSEIHAREVRDYSYPRDLLSMGIGLKDSQICQICRCVF